MKLDSVYIKNFRNINELDLKLSDFNVLVGENNVGKTNILTAICRVLSRKVYFKDKDFKNPENPIIIELNFNKFKNDEGEAIFFDFDGLKNPKNNEVTIRVIAEWKESINDVSTSIKFIRKDLLEDEQEIKDVPWSFRKYVSCYYIPAHRDLKKDIESKKGIFDLMKTFKPLYTIPFPSLKKEILEKIDELFSIDETCDFNGVQKNIKSEVPITDESFKKIPDYCESTLKEVITKKVKDLEIYIGIFNKRLEIHSNILSFKENLKDSYNLGSIEQKLNGVASEIFLEEKMGLNLISIDDEEFLKNISLEIGGYPALSQGDGYQNIMDLIITLLKFIRIKNIDDTEFESFFIIIEEPESHLHPQMQRNLIKTLKNIQEKFKEDGLNLQFILSTHSPFIISPLKFENLIFIRKDETKTYSIKLENDVAEEIFNELYPEGHTKRNKKIKKINRRLETLFKYSDVFFSKCVILTEGPTEKGAIPLFANKLGKDLDKFGISLLQSEGEGNLKYYAYLFFKLGIPTVLVVDSDKESEYEGYDNIFIVGNVSYDKYDNRTFELEIDNGAFELEILFNSSQDNSSHAKILRSMDLQSPQSSSNRIANLKGIFPKLKGEKIEELEDVSRYLEEEDKENQKYRKCLLEWMNKEKGFFFGRILAEELDETEIPKIFDDAIKRSVILARGKENEAN